jgi:hypothetical protein
MIVSHDLAENEQRLKIQLNQESRNSRSEDLWLGPKKGFAPFPRAFRILFPNGWADMAEREGFELPAEDQKK